MTNTRNFFKTAFVLLGSLATAQQIKLSEDLELINAYPKNIYQVNEVVYIDIDLVTIKYPNVDEKVIVNKSRKLRTYIVDGDTLIYSDDCKQIGPMELLKRKDIILNNTSIVMAGKSKNGKMVSANFGCYE